MKAKPKPRLNIGLYENFYSVFDGFNENLETKRNNKLTEYYLYLPVRLIHYLELNSRIQTIGNLLDLSINKLLSERNIGKNTVIKILVFLDSLAKENSIIIPVPENQYNSPVEKYFGKKNFIKFGKLSTMFPDLQNADPSILARSPEFYADLFPARLINIIDPAWKIKTIKELLELDINEILDIKSIGVTTLINLCKAFEGILGISFRPVHWFPETFENAYNIQEIVYKLYKSRPAKAFNDLLNMDSIATENADQINLADYAYLFPFRFKMYLEKNPHIKTLKDYLEIKVKDMLCQKNIGRKTVEDTFGLIKEILKGDHVPVSKETSQMRVLLPELNLEKEDIKTVIVRYFCETIIDYLKSISKKENNILALRFKKGKTLEQIGAEHNLTRERIRQLIKKNVGKLYKMLCPYSQPFKEYIRSVVETTGQPCDSLFEGYRLNKNYLTNFLVEIYPSIPVRSNLLKYPGELKTKNEFEKIVSLIREFNIEILGSTPAIVVEKLDLSDVDDILTLYRIFMGSNKPKVLRTEETIRKNPRPNLNEMITALITGSEVPMHYTDIRDKIKADNKSDYSYNSLQAYREILLYNREIIYLGKGVIASARHLKYPEEEWPQINTLIDQYLQGKKRPVYISEIWSYIKQYYPEIKKPNELLLIIRKNKEIKKYRGKYFAHVSLDTSEITSPKDLLKQFFASNKRVMKMNEILEFYKKNICTSINNVTCKIYPFLINYGYGYWGLDSLDSMNKKQLSGDSDFIRKVITCRLFPYTSLDNVMQYFNQNGYDCSRICEIIPDMKKILIGTDHLSGKRLIIHENWSSRQVIAVLLFNLGSPLEKERILRFFNLTNKTQYIDGTNWLVGKIRFNENKFSLAEDFRYEKLTLSSFA